MAASLKFGQKKCEKWELGTDVDVSVLKAEQALPAAGVSCGVVLPSRQYRSRGSNSFQIQVTDSGAITLT